MYYVNYLIALNIDENHSFSFQSLHELLVVICFFRCTLCETLCFSKVFLFNRDNFGNESLAHHLARITGSDTYFRRSL